jgi:hypothetical protein
MPFGRFLCIVQGGGGSSRGSSRQSSRQKSLHIACFSAVASQRSATISAVNSTCPCQGAEGCGDDMPQASSIYIYIYIHKSLFVAPGAQGFLGALVLCRSLSNLENSAQACVFDTWLDKARLEVTSRSLGSRKPGSTSLRGRESSRNFAGSHFEVEKTKENLARGHCQVENT